MADSAALLKMLEPAVRPVQGPETDRRSQQRAPGLEEQSFEALLEQAQGLEGPAQMDAEAAGPAQGGQRSNPLGPLAQVGAVENASLRTLLEPGPAAERGGSEARLDINERG